MKTTEQFKAQWEQEDEQIVGIPQNWKDYVITEWKRRLEETKSEGNKEAEAIAQMELNNWK